MAESITLEELLSDQDVAKRICGLNFEGGLKLLEELVERVESGALALDKAVSAYEKGVKLIEHLRAQLAGAEEKLRVLQKDSKKSK